MGQVSTKITADTSGFKKAVEEAKNMLKAFSNEESVAADTMRKVYDVTQDQVRAFKKVTADIEKATLGTKTNKQASAALERELQKLRQQWDNLSGTARRSDFGKAMSQSIRQTETRLKQLRSEIGKTNSSIGSMGKGVAGASGKFDLLGGAVAKIGGAVAIAEASFKLFEDAMKSSESGIDAWESKIASAETTYNRFVAALGRGDLNSAFDYKKWAESMKLGEDSYNKSDDLDTFQGVNVLYKQNLFKDVAELQTAKSEGKEVGKEEVDAVIQKGNKYYQDLEFKVKQAALAKFKSQWNSTEVKWDDQRLIDMIYKIGEGQTDVTSILAGQQTNGTRARELGKQISSLKQQKTDWADANRGIDFDTYQQKMQEFEDKISVLEEESDALLNIDINNDVAKELANNEGALRKYIKAIADLKQEQTGWLNVQRRLNRLTGTASTPETPKVTKKDTKKDEIKLDEVWLNSAGEEIEYMPRRTPLDVGKFEAQIKKEIGDPIADAVYQSAIEEIETLNFADEKRAEYNPESHLAAIADLTSRLSTLRDTVASFKDIENPFDFFSSLVGVAQNIIGITDVVKQMGNAIKTLSRINQAEGQAEIALSQAKTTANMSETASDMTEAGAKTMKAHASIPFVGVAIAAGLIGAMIPIIASIKNKAPKKFANGGLVYGPTYGLMGEYSGASNNPEVVAPLDKLRGMLRDQNGGGGDVTFHIEGRTLVGVLNKENRLNSRR